MTFTVDNPPSPNQVSELMFKAECGCAESQYEIGRVYSNGWHIECDQVKAMEWFLKSAKQKHVLSSVLVGLEYYQSLFGISPVDYEKAYKFLMNAAEQGEPESQFLIGLMSYNGHGIERDYDEAAHWYALASEKKHIEALWNFGVMAWNGEGQRVVFEDDPNFDTKKIAVGAFQEAAKLDHALSQFALVRAFAEGLGCKKDLEKSYFWKTQFAAQMADQKGDIESICAATENELKKVGLIPNIQN